MLMRPDVISDTRPLPLWQTAQFAAALRLIGTDADVRPLGLAGQVMTIRRTLGPLGHVSFASRGPVWADNCDAETQVRALHDSWLHIVNADGTSPDVMRRAGYRRLMRPAMTAQLELKRDPDSQLAACKGKWRNAYRQGTRGKLMTVHRPFYESKDAWIFDRDDAQQRTKGYRALPPDVVRAMAQNDPQQVRVSTAFHGPKPIAAMLFLTHGAAATYHIGWTKDAGRAANAHHVLLMQAAKRFAQEGIKQIELGLIDPDKTPGLARFKLGSGAKIHTLGGTWVRMPFARRR